MTKEAVSSLKIICEKSGIAPHLATKRQDIFGQEVLTIHTAAANSSVKKRLELQSELKKAHPNTRVKVRSHSFRKPNKAKTLEQFLETYNDGVLEYDPTGAFRRSENLINFSRLVRSELGDAKIAGIFWQSNWRTAYVVLDHAAYFKDEKVKVSDLENAEKAIRNAMSITCNAEYVSALRIGFELPAVKLVPVDNASLIQKSDLLKKLIKFAKVPAFASMIGLGGVMLAGQAAAESHISGPMPAVSSLNAKIAIRGGWADYSLKNNNSDTYPEYNTPIPTEGGRSTFVEGSVTAPIGDRFGLQVDGAWGQKSYGTFKAPSGSMSSDENIGRESIYGIGVHLFARDPMTGLIGLTASQTHFGGLGSDYIYVYGYTGSYPYPYFDGRAESLKPERDVIRFGVEGELYVEQFTIAAAAGWQRTNLHWSQSVKDGYYGDLLKSQKSGNYASVDINWYATDNLMFTIGAGRSDGGDTLKGGVEWAPALEGINGLTLFADITDGPESDSAISAGIRIYFGQGASLKERHRYDDPVNNLVMDTVNSTAGRHLGYN